MKVLPVSRQEEERKLVEKIENPDLKGSALIFGDSFAEGWFPFLGYAFGKVTFYRLYDRVSRFDAKKLPLSGAHYWKPELIEQQKPTIVIDEIVENSLRHEDPRITAQLDGLK